MKKLLIATAATLALTGAASAADLSYHAYTEYALEAESLEFGAGAAYAVDAVTFTADVTVLKYNGEKLNLDSVDLGVSYAITDITDVYGVISLDSDLQYNEATIGVAVNF
jgi:opacity protein-like surface antigen